MDKRIKRLIYLAVTVFLAVAVFTAVQYWQHRDLVKISFHVIPEDSQLTVDGAKINGQSPYVAPGNHTVVASKDGFLSDKETFTAVKKAKNDVYLSPTPQSQEALKWAADHPDLEAKRIQYAQINETKRQDLFKARYPLIKYLPLDTVYYDITYGKSEKYPDDQNKIAIYITSKPQTRDMALQWIKFKRFNPGDYEIIYKNP